MHWTEPSETENAAARSSAQELRKQRIASQAVDVLVAVGPNLFYTVTRKERPAQGVRVGSCGQNVLRPTAVLGGAVSKTQVAESESQVTTLQRQIQNLRRTRALLRPRLLSGEVNLAEK